MVRACRSPGSRATAYAGRTAPSGAAPGFAGALLVRRGIADPEEATSFPTHAPQGTALAGLAGLRWTVEGRFEQAKGEVGLSQHEVRSWVSCHRHAALPTFALA